MHPHLTSGKNLEIVWSKSHLVMRMIEMRIGQEPLLQVLYVHFCSLIKENLILHLKMIYTQNS